MDIKLVSFADKVTGATDATGKVSSDDINQLKKVLNGVVSALFDLDSSNTATTEIIRSAALPDIDIYDGIFNTSDFVVSGGLISLSNGSSLPVAPALTAGVVNDGADTFTATLPNGYSATDVERTFDGGITWAAVTSLPLPVGNSAFAIGQVGLRIKATSERQHSSTLYNATAFTTSTGGNPDAGFSAVTAWNADPDITVNGNNVSWIYNAPNTYRFFNNTTLKSVIGSPFELRFTIDPTKDLSAVLGFSAQSGGGYSPNRMQYTRSSDTHGLFTAITGGSNYVSSPGFDFTTPPRGRIRDDGTNLTLDYSTDGGNTWLNIQTIPSYTVVQYIQGGFTQFNSIMNAASLNIIQKGLVAA